MNEIEIIESPAQRAQLATRTDVLEKVKHLATVDGKDFATTEQVAVFYEADKSTISHLVQYHLDEFEANGYRNISGAELRQVKEKVSSTSKYARQLGVFDRRAVLLLGMLLRDSEVAKEVRRYLLEVEDKVHEAVVHLAARSTFPRLSGYFAFPAPTNATGAASDTGQGQLNSTVTGA